MSHFPLVNFVESVESPESEQIVLEINALQKSRELLLKIGPIEGVKFGGAKKLPYLCAVIRKHNAGRGIQHIHKDTQRRILIQK